MEFEDQEEEEDQAEEMEMAAASYESPLDNSRAPATVLKMQTSEVLMTTQQQQQQLRKPRYRECLKNHAVGIGGHALDGCGEFLAAGAEGTLDALKCAACNCHRNFHRKETDSNNSTALNIDPFNSNNQLLPHHPHAHQYPHGATFPPYYRSTPAGYLQLTLPPSHHHRPLALPSTSGGGGSHSRGDDQDQDDMSNPSGGGGDGHDGSGGTGFGSKKRFRTKFTQEQKEKMLGLAEKLGWRIQKHDDAVVQQFCNETGVKRHVLKVWMHNNKHTLAPKERGDQLRDHIDGPYG